MPGILAERSANSEGFSEGKGGPISEGGDENQQTEESGGSLGDSGQNQKLKEALEELNLDKNGETEMEEDEQQPRLSSPDSANLSFSTCSTSEVEAEKAASSNEHGQEKEEETAAEASGEKEKADSKGKAAPATLAEAGFITVHLKMPGVPHPVDVMLTSRDTVHDLLQYALERPECCFRTALSVRHKGKRLDDFFEIGSIENLSDGDTVELVEESYSQREVRTHVQRLKDLLSTNPLQQAMSCSDGLTLSFLASITITDPEEGASRVGDDLTDPTKLEPPSFILPQLLSTDPAHQPDHTPSLVTPPPLTPFYPPNLSKQFKFPDCLKSLCYSSWNPPPSARKMKGDLAYLEVTTLEGQVHYITATPTGFYLNRSTSQENFDPTPKKAHHHSRHLVGLLSQISPLFKKNFSQLQKFGDHRHAFEVLPVPYPVVPWVTPRPEHKPASFRIDDSLGLRAVPDEVVLGQMRDWNEELQTARELPTDSPAAKVFRDRTLFKVHSDFVQASRRGAVAAIDGMLTPLNPGDEQRHRMYIWNNIFFSLASDGRDHYKEFGGDEAAHAAAGADLQGVAAYERLDSKGLFTLGTVLVDYRGFRVVCQSIIPGLLQKEQDSAVVYGSTDTGKTVFTNDKFKELLKKIANDFHIKDHKIRTEKDEVVTLPSSFEVKGIIGNDSRHYALDLFRIFPPDANFLVRPEGTRIRHKMAVLRPEMIDTFLSYKFMMFLKLVREKTCTVREAQKEQKEKEKEKKENKSSGDGSKTAGEGEGEGKAETSDEVSKDASSTTTTTDDVDAMVTSNSEQDEASTQTNTTTSTLKSEASAAREGEEPDMAGEGKEEGDMEGKNESKDGKDLPSPPPTDSSSDKMDTSPVPPTASSSTSIAPTSGLSPSLGGLGRHRGLTEQLSCSPSSLSRVSNNMAAMSASKVTAAGSTCLSSSMTPSEQLKQQQLLQIVEASDLLVGSDVLLLESQVASEEKEVGPEIPGDQEQLSKLDTILEGGKEELDKELTSSELEDHPEVAAAIREAAREAGSSSAEEYTVKFNVDILAPNVKHADSQEELLRDRQLVMEAAGFLTESVASRFIRDCIQLTVTPTDGEALKAALHTRGINIRYLGFIAQIAAKREDLRHLMHLCISEMVVRVAKKRFRKLLQDTPLQLTSEAVAHFLNCFLSTLPFPEGTQEEQHPVQNGHAKKSRKKKGARNQKVPAHLKITSVTLWAEIKEEVDWYYRHTLEYSSVADMCAKTKLHQLALLRELCKKMGVQLLYRDYDFTVQPVFTDDDVIAMVPIVKHTDFRPLDPITIFELAQTKFSQGDLKSALELFEDSLQMFVQVYGPIHTDIANCYRHLARLNYILNNPVNALAYQHKATLVFERVLGVDHPETLSAYVNLALYCHNTNQTATALRLLYRARYLLLLMFGEDHPEMATCDSNIAIILHTIRDYKNSLLFLESTKRIHEKYHGSWSLQTALTHHLMARVQSFLGDFRAALSHEKTTFSIYNKKFGGDHERTKESSLCLNELTEKAVTMQKTINEMISRGAARVLVDLPGSWGEVVGMVSGGQDPRQQAHAQQRSRPHIVRKRKKHGKQQQTSSTE